MGTLLAEAMTRKKELIDRICPTSNRADIHVVCLPGIAESANPGVLLMPGKFINLFLRVLCVLLWLFPEAETIIN